MRELTLGDFFSFGKYKGEQVEDVLNDDPGYIAWLYEEDVVDFCPETIRIMEDRKII